MTRADILLALVANRPEGAKVDIGGIRRAMTPSQGQIIVSIQWLIDRGMLDPQTLRRPATQPETSAEPVARPSQAPAPEGVGGGVDSEDAKAPPPTLKPKGPPSMAERARRWEEAHPPVQRASVDDDVVQHFRADWELLGTVAKRAGLESGHQLRRAAKALRDKGLLEFIQRDPQCLWRLAKPNTRGACGTAREASTASESTDAKPGIEATASPPEAEPGERIEDRAPPSIPAEAASLPVDPPASPDEPTDESEVAGVTLSPPRPALEDAKRSVVIEVNSLPTPGELAAEIDAFLKRVPAISKSRMGMMVTGSPSWFPNLCRRKSLREEEVTRAREIMAAHRQADNVETMIGPRPVHWTRRRALERIEQGLPVNLDDGVSVKIQQEAILRERAEQARLADPVEQAKTLIRRKTRFSVFSATVTLGEHGKGKFYVGQNLFTQDELLAYARRLEAAA